MSARRSLSSRQSRDDPRPQAQVQRTRQPTALPPYEPPSCPMTETAKRSLADISANHDYRKYERHIEAALLNITNCAGDINDRLQIRKDRVKRIAEKREATDPEAEKSRAEEEAEERAGELEEKVDRLTAESEKALRDLIDFKEELAGQRKLVEQVSSETTANVDQMRAAQARKARRRETRGSDDEDAEAEMEVDIDMEDVGEQAAILSPIEVMKKLKDEHETAYKSQSMRKRYAEHNDYIGFKRMIHDAQNPGDTKPPMPHASTWFAEDAQSTNKYAARRRRLASQTDNTQNGDEEDDEIQMIGVVSSLKCPLTLKTFKEPYSNHVCKHTFEKSAILDYHRSNAVAFADPSQPSSRRGARPQGPKRVKCPERGCDAMLEVKDFYDDAMIARQVKRQAAAEMEEEDDIEGEDEDAESQEEEEKHDSAAQRPFAGNDGASYSQHEQRVKHERRSQTLNHKSSESQQQQGQSHKQEEEEEEEEEEEK